LNATSPADTVPGVLRDAAGAHPEVEAVVDGDRRLTYGELASEARRAAGAFVAVGVTPGDRVAIWAPNSLEWIVAYLGLSSAGAVLVPLNTRYQGAEAAEIIRRSRAKLLVTVGSFLGRDYPALIEGESLPDLQSTIVLGEPWEAFLAGADDPAVLAEVDRRVAALGPEDWLDLMFTSGTTGAPKGVATRHGDMVRSYRYYADTLGIVQGDRYLLANPLFHSFGSKAGVVAAMLAGATLVPVPVFDPAVAADLIERERITVFPGPPTIYHALLELPPDRLPALQSLRLAVTGAASVPVELLRRMSAELGFDVVLTAYGLTETGGLLTMCRAGDPLEVVSRTCGRAIPGVELATLGPDGTPTPVGEPGEVAARGYCVPAGYYEDPVATAEAIDANGWFHTGDIGILDEAGGLRITDRIKDMYIVGGFNAYPAEIEAALMELPSVAQVAVIGVPDERLGEVGVAFVIPRTGATVEPDEIIAFARGRLANFKVPRRVEIVEAFPLNASGKVRKTELRDRYAVREGVEP
jgi:acyl-CoA synthetase (AMP-forming)/AMP-acid ligase II